MTVRWEQRVRAALVAPHRAPLDARVFAGALVVRTRLARWTRRAGIAVLATVTGFLALVTFSTVAALIALLNAL